MKFTLHTVDVTEHVRAQKVPPPFPLSRPKENPSNAIEQGFSSAEIARAGVFWVVQSPISPQQPLSWSMIRREADIFVPLIPYRTPTNSSHTLPAHGVQMGLLALESLMARDEKPKFPIETIIIISNQLYDLNPVAAAYGYSLGLAFRTE